MLFLTTPNIEGKKIIEYHGLVTGEALLGANVYKDLFSGVRDVVGGRTSAYEEELKKARDIALESVEEKTAAMGANAIVGVRIKYNNLGGTMGNTIMVTVIGTAVSYTEQ
ncbi:MAG: heavy metal-binding domain-containing protein [Euryarchaeota archaeon]|nr:heavy metal-binding domain-containing protein [Euryarchaeota archaeon]